ncbi:MAG: hypothetical protein KF724_13035 [Phycisphaeraceae bacterium]|nr:hypothetical protein [Phycisphaeraceae bacterium]
MSRFRTPVMATGLVAATLLCGTSAFGQAASGHALDASLRVGDGGYNYATSRSGPPLHATRYAASRASSRAFWSPAGGNLQRISEDRVRNEDIFFYEKSYDATRRSSSYSGPPTGGGGGRGGGYNPGATRIDTRIE